MAVFLGNPSCRIAAAEVRRGPFGVRLVAMIELAYGSGLRSSELVSLRLAEVQRAKDTMVVRGRAARSA